jgi:hypothetical protein
MWIFASMARESKLLEWHENLKTECAQIGTTISNEILKCKIELAEYKSKMEIVSINFEMQLQNAEEQISCKRDEVSFCLSIFTYCCCCFDVLSCD